VFELAVDADFADIAYIVSPEFQIHSFEVAVFWNSVTGFVFGDAGIFSILFCGYYSEVAPSVVHSVPVDMVNLTWITWGNIENKPMQRSFVVAGVGCVTITVPSQ